MKRAIGYSALFFFVVVFPCLCLADDIDMYDTSTVKPNVLIIFDNSGTMSGGVSYNDSDTYQYPTGSYTYSTSTIYRRQCLRWSWYRCISWGSWQVYTGTFTDTNHDGIHDSDTNIRKGNRLNYDYGDYNTRIGVAKNAIKDIIEQSKNYVRFGIMVLNGAKDINDSGVTYSQYHNDTTVLSTTYGGALIIDRTDAQIETLKTQIDNMTADGGTPLANRLINAAKYFRGQFGSYTSPIDAANWCRKNFVIIMTDGKPEGEGDSYDANNVGEYDFIEGFLPDYGHPRHWDYDNDGNDPDPSNDYVHGGSDYLDDVAKYLYATDDSLDTGHAVSGNQNLTIYTIGFHVDHQLLTDTAVNGGGAYYTTSSSHELSVALQAVMETIIEQTQTFTAPVVPVQRTTSGNKMYISLFTPKAHDKFWPGYLMKLHIGSDGHLYGNDETTPATDDEDNLLLDTLLASTGSPQPYWEVHEVLKGVTLDSRNIYTYYTGSTADLNNSANAFVTTNASITSAMLGTPSKSADAQTGTTAQYDLMRYIRGYDAYDQDVDAVYTEKRENIFGDILHSKPLIIDYVTDYAHPTNNVRVVYVGTNDGMLHAIDDSNGSEKWAFIPPDLLPKLKNMIEGSGHQYYVDGAPKAYIKDVDKDGNIEAADGDKVIVIFGERGGGTSYTAIDVTDPNDPQYLWRIDNANATITGIPNPTTIITEMGESWAEPEIGKVRAGTVGSETDTIVAFIGGGYNSTNTKGRGLFIINALTGALVKDYTVANSGTYPVLANMTSCVPSTVLAVDTTFDGYVNRVYVGDTGGQMWRFGNQAGSENGNVNNWTPRRLFQGNSGTKIFYPPDLVLESGYAYLYFGSGDRNEPMYCPSPDPHINRFYAVKDKNETDAAFQSRVGGVLAESRLVDMTADLLQDPGTSETTKNTIRTQLANGDGWYIIMEHDGEKVLAAPVAIYGVVIFTTFTPASDTCSYGGDARVYAVNYLTAEAVWDLDTANTGLQKADRSKVIGYGIPTEAVVVIGADGIARVYIAVGGKIVLLDESFNSTGFTVNSWREIF